MQSRFYIKHTRGEAKPFNSTRSIYQVSEIHDDTWLTSDDEDMLQCMIDLKDMFPSTPSLHNTFEIVRKPIKLSLLQEQTVENILGQSCVDNSSLVSETPVNDWTDNFHKFGMKTDTDLIKEAIWRSFTKLEKAEITLEVSEKVVEFLEQLAKEENEFGEA